MKSKVLILQYNFFLNELFFSVMSDRVRAWEQIDDSLDPSLHSCLLHWRHGDLEIRLKTEELKRRRAIPCRIYLGIGNGRCFLNKNYESQQLEGADDYTSISSISGCTTLLGSGLLGAVIRLIEAEQGVVVSVSWVPGWLSCAYPTYWCSATALVS